MSDVTVAQFAEVLKVPVDRLLVQLESAGIQVEGPSALISDEAKLELLTHLRRAHGASEPTSKSQGLRGYRVGATATLEYPGEFEKASFFGQFVYGSSLATLSGGPEDPSGTSYTLSYKVDPAFVDIAGTQYYRRTQVTATIP